MILEQMELGPMMNFVYIIGCAETREAAVVDPAWDVPGIIRAAEEAALRIRHVLLTHGHPDHMNGLEELLNATDAAVHLHADETDYMRMAAEYFGIRVDFMNRRSANFRPVSDGSSLNIGKLSLEFLHTPGHTPGSQCFLIENNLVSGDTLFINACGRVDLPGGDPEKMWWSLNHRLRALEDETVLYPGHNYAGRLSSTVGEEKRHNPYMQYESLDRFLRAMGIF
jgi:glyoxylase-like metal-dependent hydrolase (beta-lactamase superfamily II)